MSFKVTLCFILISVCPLDAQFESGSDGSDGALSITTPGDFLFVASAFDPPLDQDGDGIFNFTTINVAADVTVKYPASSGPIYWLATGTVKIDGALNLNGGDGHNGGDVHFRASPGTGGFSGGMGGTQVNPPEPGNGPGRGLPNSTNCCDAGGAGYAGDGQDGANASTGGKTYGNLYLLPMIGGSGGAGAHEWAGSNGSGGGGGGGAILIASSKEIIVDGSIEANGGNGGSNVGVDGGGGSGGAIRLVAPIVRGAGLLSAKGGTGGGFGAPGRIRIEGNVFSGTVNGSSTSGPPGLLFLSADQAPVRIVSIDGIEIPAIPHGGFVPPDVTISNAAPVNLVIAARGVPVDTVITLTLIPEFGQPISVESTPLIGTIENSTATASVSVPFGFSRFFVQANWNP